MPLTPKEWKDGSTGGTKLSAAALIDLETRLGAYTDGSLAAVNPATAGTLPPVNLAAGKLHFQYAPAYVTRLFEGTLGVEWNLAGVGEVEPTVVAEHAKSGKAAKFKLTTTQVRSELILANQNTEAKVVREGQLYKFSMYVYIPVGGMQYGGAGHHNTIWQLHTKGSEPEGMGTCFSLELAEYEAGKKGLWVEAREPETKKETHYWVGEVSEGALHQITVEFIPSARYAGYFKIYIDGAGKLEKSAVMTVPGTEVGYLKCGIYSGKEGTRELFISQVEFEELSNGQVTIWLGRSGLPPVQIGQFQSPQYTTALATQSGHAKANGSVSVAAGTTVEVNHGLKVEGEAVVPKTIQLTPQNIENGLEPKIYLRQVGSTVFEIRNSSAKAFTVYWTAEI